MKMFITRIVIILRKIRDWFIAQAIFTILWLLSKLPAKKATAFADRVARYIGPKTKRHRLALENLKRAFPEKTILEREKIAHDMWGNMSRLAAEYIFLDEIFDYDPDAQDQGIIEVSGADIFEELRNNPRPFIVFTAHTGNFELLPIASATFGLNITALFRPPNNQYIAKRVLSARQTKMGHLVPSRAGASWALANELEAGRGVGMLVDQHFHKGSKTKFFGQDVLTSPLLAKLVRQYNCDVYPSRSIRLPNGRFRLEIEPAIKIPHKSDGSVDIQATGQVLNDKVEEWAREYPGQWQWFHDRWRIKNQIK